eukprot:Colp12_sorted_trinity150504_noHs@9785
MSTSEVVLLLRDPSEDDPDPYEKAFADAGFIPTSCPVLKCEPCNLDDLKNLLTVPSNYSGLIFPSKNAVKSLEISLGANPEVAQEWKGKLVYAVGEATGRLLNSIGFTVTGEKSGTADNLSKLIIAQHRDARPLLFLCGNKRRDVLPKTLTEAGIPFQEMIVYSNNVNSNFEEDFLKCYHSSLPNWIAFFSPSGLHALMPILEKHGLEKGSSVRYAAIGPTTAQAMLEISRPPAAVAQKPTPQSLLDAIKHTR